MIDKIQIENAELKALLAKELPLCADQQDADGNFISIMDVAENLVEDGVITAKEYEMIDDWLSKMREDSRQTKH